MNTVFLESPYSGATDEIIARNVKYARACCTHSYHVMGEAPVALHLLYTQLPEGQFVSDNEVVLRGREFALQCCREVRKKMGRVVFYVDLGWSNGMLQSRAECEKDGIPWEVRWIYEKPVNPDNDSSV